MQDRKYKVCKWVTEMDGQKPSYLHPYVFRFLCYEFSTISYQISTLRSTEHPHPQNYPQAASFHSSPPFHRPSTLLIQMLLGAGKYSKTHQSCNHELKYKTGPLVQGNLTRGPKLIYLSASQWTEHSDSNTHSLL